MIAADITTNLLLPLTFTYCCNEWKLHFHDTIKKTNFRLE